MELNVAKPSPDFGGNLRVRVNGSARLWEHSYKGTEIGLTGGAVGKFHQPALNSHGNSGNSGDTILNS